MLPKPLRLNLKKEFKSIASGQRVEDEYFKMFVKSLEQEKARVGISVAKAVFKNAVERNRARRLSSAGIQELYHKLPDQINLIIMPKKGCLNLNSAQIKEDLELLLKRVNVF